MKDDAAQQDSQPRDEFLTARQLAIVLQVSETTVRRLAQNGRVPCIRLTPRLMRFHLQSVRDALNGVPASRPRHTTKATEDPTENPQLSFSDLL